MGRARIAIDCRYVRDRPSGIGAYVRGLIDWLPELAPDIDWILLRHHTAPKPLSRAPNVREKLVPFEASGPVTMWALPAVVRLRGVDLFHAPFNIAPAGLPVPYVTTIHDLMWLEQPGWCRRPGPWGAVETFYWQHGLRRALAGSQRIFTVSQASKDAIAARDPAAGARTHVTRLGIDAFFRPAEGEADRAAIRAARQRWIPRAERYVIAVGQLAGYKNHEGVVRSFALAFGADPSMHLVLVQRLGRGSRLLPIVRAGGIEQRVHFLSGVPGEELRALMWGATALSHPSFMEGFGLPVAEALACGCPVVTSDRSAMPEVTAGNALHVDPYDDRAIADALVRLASDEALRADLRARGLARARELVWRKTAEQTLEVLRELV